MKRAICALAALALALCGVGAPAETTAASVTLAVKSTLEIDDHYTEFYSDSYANRGVTAWSLHWADETGSTVDVTADDQGKIMAYNAYDAAKSGTWSPYFDARFPGLSVERAVSSAEAFLGKVLTGDEGALLDEAAPELQRSGQATVDLTGAITLGGIETENRFSIQVDSETGIVSSYWRSDADTIYASREIAEARIAASDAERTLEKPLSLSLEYVTDGDRAVLRYLPKEWGNFAVDAATGERVDRSENVAPGARNMALGVECAAMDSGSAAKLTHVETAGAALLDDAMSREALDAAARGHAALGLGEKYALNGVDYSVDRETEEVTAQASYWMTLTADQAVAAGLCTEEGVSGAENPSFTVRKYVQMDAYTARVLRVWTDYPYLYGPRSEDVDADKYRDEAEAFLREVCPQALEASDLTDSRGSEGTYYGAPTASYTYSRFHEGVVYRDNALQVTYNAALDCVDGYGMTWTDDIAFDSASPNVTEAEALAACRDAIQASLRYCNLVSSMEDDGPIYALTLCYVPLGASEIRGVDAATGEIVTSDSRGEGVTYGDLGEDESGAALKLLAKYGVGYSGGSARSDEDATWRDYLSLLYSAGGYGQEADDEELIRWAKSEGVSGIDAAQMEKTVARVEAVRALVQISGFGRAAMLPDIYVCGFGDDSDIGKDDYGYVAVAKGLGVALAQADGGFHPDAAATRGEAAEMLVRFLSRTV